MIKVISFVIVSILLLNNSLCAQSYLSYHKSIQKAEESIYNGEYDKALAIYNKAFEEYPRVFYNDLHNACLCALKTDDYSKGYIYSKRLVAQGCELNYFDDKAFDKLRTSKYWQDFRNEYDEIRNDYLVAVDYDLREEYLKLACLDQSDQRIGQPEEVADSIFYVNAIRTLELIKANGFPRWGLDNDTIVSKINILFGHYCILYNQMNAKGNEEKYNNDFYAEVRNSLVLDSIRIYLKEALFDGFITPQVYVANIAFRDNTNPYGEIAILIDFDTKTVSPYFIQTEEEYITINMRRESIGLPALSPETTQNYIDSSWYRDYPFEQVKEAIAECNGCPIPNFIIMAEVEGEFSENYKKEGTDGFRLHTLLGSSVSTIVNGTDL